MKLLPYDTFIIQSQDSISVVCQQLVAHIEAPNRMRMSRSHAAFEGKISDSGFEISRVINYRNSFLPQICGRFQQIPGGTAIHVTMRIHPLMIWLTCCWYTNVFIALVVPTILFRVIPSEMSILFVGVSLAMLPLFWYAFWFEAQRSRDELTRIILRETATISSSPHRFSSPTAKSFVRAMLLVVGVVASSVFNWGMFVEQEAEICQSNKSISPYCNLTIVKTIQDNQGRISDIAITPDNLTLVSGSEDRGIKLWDLRSGKLKQKFPSNSVAIGRIAIAPDGKTVVTGNEGKILRVWNLATGKQLAILKGHQNLEGYGNSVSSIIISPNSQTVVSTASFSNEIKVWDVNTGRLKHTLSQLPPSFNPASTPTERVDLEISGIAITPDGQTIVSVNKDRICWWDLASGKLRTTIDNTAGIEKLVSIDRDNLATVTTISSARVKTLDLKTGKIHQEMGDRFGRFGTLIATADRQYAIGGRSDRSSSFFKIWNLQTGQLLVDKLTRGSMLAVSPDRQTIVSATGSTIEIWR